MQLNSLPPDLQELQRFLLFQVQPRPNGRRGKVPVRLGGSRLYLVSPSDPAAWLPFSVALKRLEAGYGDGLGLVFSPDLGIVGVDLDDVMTAGELHPRHAALIARLDGYTEWSVSGEGLHVLVRGVIPGPRRRAAGLEFVDNGFITVTGQSVAPVHAHIPQRQSQLAALYSETFPTASASRPPPIRPLHTDEQVFDALLSARNADRIRRLLLEGDAGGYPSLSEADFALARLIGWATDDPEQVIRIMHRSALARPERWGQGNYLRRTVERALALGYPHLRSHRPVLAAVHQESP